VTLRICLAGEGKNELGGRSGDPAYWKSMEPKQIEPGVLETLLRRVKGDGWEIAEAIEWKRLRKLKLRPNGAGREADNVRKAALHASENGCDALVFSRDRDDSDDHPNQAREDDIETGIRAAIEDQGHRLTIAGSVAIRRLESWILALEGRTGSEDARRPEEALESLQVHQGTRYFVEVVESANLDAIPEDARSLRGWLDRAREALGRPGS
jgi:hypothetical protein